MRPRPTMPTVLCERPWPHIHRGFHEVQPPLQGGRGAGERPWFWAKMRAAAQTPHSQAGAVVQGQAPPFS